MIKPSPMIFNTFQVFKPDLFTFSTFRIQRDGIPKFKKALGLGLNSAKPVGIGIKFRTTLGCTLPYLASWFISEACNLEPDGPASIWAPSYLGSISKISLPSTLRNFLSLIGLLKPGLLLLALVLPSSFVPRSFKFKSAIINTI